MAKKTGTNILLACPCGAKAAVIQNGESRWFSHCPACGTIQFWSSPQLTERARAGGKLCSHHVHPKLCKNGTSETTWCPTCRVRTFSPSPGGM